MDNERFPEQEEPIIEELSFSPEPEEAEGPAEEAVLEEIPGAPAEDVPAQTPPLTGAEFMASIPDVDEDYPPEPDPSEYVEVPEDYDAPQTVPETAEEENSFGKDLFPDIGQEDLSQILDDPDVQQYRDNGRDPSAAEEVPAPEPPAPARARPMRKGRPKRKKGEGLLGIPNILVTIVWLALIVAIGVTAGRMVWVCAADVLAFGREDKAVTVTVYESDSMEDVTNKLYDAGLIRYKSLFDLYASISHAEDKIKPGIYDLNTRYDYHALVNFMTPRSNREVVKVTIPEGYTCRQIFDLLEESKVCTARDIAAYAATGELDDYWFLTYVERGDKYCLEGFLFPDTYEFYKNSTPKEALQRMLNNFGTRFDEQMQSQIDTLNDHLAALMRTAGQNEEYIAAHRFTTKDIVTVASLIEKETSSAEESPTIASVIYNRLFNWGGNPAYLNIDASIVYAQDGNADTIDTSIDSPYNTYTNVGLTPTPIANPGLASLRAALAPASTNYYFYVLDPNTGVHQFSTTVEEHNAYVAQFREAE